MAENLFRKMGFIPDATPEDIKYEAVVHASEIIRFLQEIPKMNADTMLHILATAVRIGVLADGKIDENEKKLIRDVFSEICDAPFAEIMKVVDRPLDDRSYRIVEDLLKMSNALGMEFVNLIICFAYADGVFEDEVSERLSALVTENVRLVSGNPEMQ